MRRNLSGNLLCSRITVVITVLLCLGFLTPVLSESEVSSKPVQLSPALLEFLSTDYQVVLKFEEIPADIREALLERMEYDPRMANPGEKFNPTDVIDEDIPCRRLVLAGNFSNLWFVCYEHGGRGYHRHLVIFKTEENKVKLIFSGRFFEKINSIDDLKDLIRRGKIPDETNESESNPEF